MHFISTFFFFLNHWKETLGPWFYSYVLWGSKISSCVEWISWGGEEGQWRKGWTLGSKTLIPPSTLAVLFLLTMYLKKKGYNWCEEHCTKYKKSLGKHLHVSINWTSFSFNCLQSSFHSVHV